LSFDPADGRSCCHIDETFIPRQVGRPVARARICEFNRLGVRAMDGAEKCITPSSRQLTLHGFGDEATPVSLQTVDARDELGVERHGYAFGGHDK
jgi:hypothetical protein